MLAMGVIDLVVDQGRGEAEVAISSGPEAATATQLAGIAAARRRVHKLDYEELLGVVEVWVDTALSLTTAT